MASGYGMGGGTSRCYSFWQEYMACYVMSRDDAALREKGPCLSRLEDYYECLHHRKEYARATAMRKALQRAERGHPRENAPSAGQIRSLGLLGHEEDTKAVLQNTSQTS